MNVRRTAAALTVTAAALSGVAMIAPAADAKGGVAPTVRSGPCATGSWKLKAKPDDGGRLEVEYQLDTNRNNQIWSVKITDNTTHQVFAGNRTTKAPSGSFSINIRPVNRAGTDHLVATAKRGNVTCTGRVAI
ncbi:MAG: hypothetical protein QOF53_1250 [Nocardioidaceae bacterium]|nr:hypothetical protein [Nocardioidaceae bacterium]